MNIAIKANQAKLTWLLALIVLSSIAVAIPEPAAEFYGKVVLHGEPASTGLNVSAFDQSGVKCGTYITSTQGYYGLLSCRGDDADTPGDEGADNGEQISFKTGNTAAYNISGTKSWSSGSFLNVDLLGLKNDSPYLYGCRNSTIEEDSNGTDVNVDLWSCAYDRNDNVSDLTFIISTESNSSLISCLISANRYLTCNDPASDQNGISNIELTVNNTQLLQWSESAFVNITPVNDSPRFVQNLSTQSASDGTLFQYDINCSDPDGDAIIYHDNTTVFEIDGSTGLINFTPAQGDVGKHSINITCDDKTLNSSQNFTLVVQDAQNPPVLDAIGALQAREGFLFTTTITATDPDNDTLTFSDNTSLFEINSSTGVINFTPSLSDVGNYSVNISVSDNDLMDFEVINFSVRRGPFCGDNICGSDETCSSCSDDCGACPVSAQPAAGEAAAAGAAAGKAAGAASAGAGRARAGYQCLEKWSCGEWSECINGYETRSCIDLNKCRIARDKPDEKRSCKAEIPSPKELEKEKKRVFARIPIPKLKIPLEIIKRTLPWSLFASILLLAVLTVTGDQVYVRHIRKAPFAVHRKKIRRYRKTRHKIYETLFNMLTITLIVSVYYYWFSTCPACMRHYVWIPALAILLTPFSVSIALKRLEYSEYRKEVAERRLKITHELQMRQMARLETKITLEVEEETLKLIRNYSLKTPKSVFIKFQERLQELIDLHTAMQSHPALDDKTKKTIKDAAQNKALAKTFHEYSKLRQLFEDVSAMASLLECGEERVLAEKNLMDGMEEVAQDHHLQSVIASSENLTESYNHLVDAYNAIKSLHKKVAETEKTEISIEAKFLEELNSLFEDKDSVEEHKEDKEWVRAYNLFVDLHEHYSKRQSAGE